MTEQQPLSSTQIERLQSTVSLFKQLADCQLSKNYETPIFPVNQQDYWRISRSEFWFALYLLEEQKRITPLDPLIEPTVVMLRKL